MHPLRKSCRFCTLNVAAQLPSAFEAHARQTDGGAEFWLARDLQQLLGYSKWDNFLNVVTKS